MEALIQKDTCTPMSIAAQLTIAKTQKQPKCPLTEEWIMKMWHIYIYIYGEREEHSSAIEKNEGMPFVA